MSRFKTWLEQQVEPENIHLTTENDKKIRELFNAILERLGGLEDQNVVVKKTLNDLTKRRPAGKRSSQAILDRIGPLMQQLSKIHGEFAQRVKDAEGWLGQETEGDNPDKTLQGLMERLFGREQFLALLNGDQPTDTGTKGALTKMQPGTVPPKDAGQGPPSPPDDLSQPDPNDPNAAGQQPQVPPAGNPVPPQPAAPNMQQPPKLPVGAFMGLW